MAAQQVQSQPGLCMEIVSERDQLLFLGPREGSLWGPSRSFSVPVSPSCPGSCWDYIFIETDSKGSEWWGGGWR